MYIFYDAAWYYLNCILTIRSINIVIEHSGMNSKFSIYSWCMFIMHKYTLHVLFDVCSLCINTRFMFCFVKYFCWEFLNYRMRNSRQVTSTFKSSSSQLTNIQLHNEVNEVIYLIIRMLTKIPFKVSHGQNAESTVFNADSTVFMNICKRIFT